MKRQACKNCKRLIESGACPVCKGTSFVPNWKGRIIILNHTESRVAKKVEITEDGEYAIKVT